MASAIAGQPGADLGDVDQAEQVGAGQPQHLVPAGRSGRVRRRRGVLRPVGASQQAPPRPRPARTAISASSSTSSRSTSGARCSREATSRDPPSSAGQPLGDRALVAQQPQVPRGLGQRVGHLQVGEQPGVRVGGVGEGAQQHGQQRPLDRGPAADPFGQRGDVPKRRGRRGEAQRREPRAPRRPGTAAALRSGTAATAVRSGR